MAHRKYEIVDGCTCMCVSAKERKRVWNVYTEDFKCRKGRALNFTRFILSTEYTLELTLSKRAILSSRLYVYIYMYIYRYISSRSEKDENGEGKTESL